MTTTTTMARRNLTNYTRRGPRQWPRKGNWEHKSRTTTMVRKRQPRTQEEDHGHGNAQKECNQEQNNMTMTTMMARKNATKNTRRRPQ
jgi:hypothetical protein